MNVGAGALREHAGGVLLNVHVQPGAARSGYAGMHGDALKFRVAAPPVDGAANDALCKYLARRLGIPRRSVTVVRGQAARRKQVLLAGVALDTVIAALESGVQDN